MFRISDLVEGIENGRWILGRVVVIDQDRLGCIVIANERKSYCNIELHNLDGVLKDRSGWYLTTENAKHAKNYIITSILNDL